MEVSGNGHWNGERHGHVQVDGSARGDGDVRADGNAGVNQLLEGQRAFFEKGATRPVSFRLAQLRLLKNALRTWEPRILAAMQQDLNKSELEAYMSEIGFIHAELDFMLRRLHSWARPARVRRPLFQMGSQSHVYYEPYGIVLVISPWNYPLQLALSPLIGALAAGNCAVLKPSELSPATSRVLAELVAECFSPAYVTVVEGGAETAQALLAARFDYIFYTGSTAVGQLVMEAAARQLTPVTLELGGKSPCIVHNDARLAVAAARIAWGKFMNAGQTCVAPDYIYVHSSFKDAFLKELTAAIDRMYKPQWEQGTFTQIVSVRHLERLRRLAASGQLYYGGEIDADNRRMAPTVLTGISWTDPVMQEEIFGPLLPVLVYDDLKEVIAAVRTRPKPLALYLFTEDRTVERTVVEQLSFGGGCVNDTIMHLTNPHLPFGGVGASGIGAYHGRASFELFSHRKSLLRQSTRLDLPFRYPHVKYALAFMRRFYK